MIKLFHIPDHKIDTSKFSNLIFDKIVTEFEQAFAKYVGAEYAVAVNSCTNGIFLALKSLQEKVVCTVPTLMTTRFLSAIEMANCDYEFRDIPEWVGGQYVLWEQYPKLDHSPNPLILDCAQKVEPNMYYHLTDVDYGCDKDIMVFSFYPTKPVGGIQGGMIVSNDKDRIDWIRQAAHFGETLSDSTNSWESTTDFKGWQMFMGTIPAYVAFENLKKYPEKRAKLDHVRNYYNIYLDNVVTNNSYHLYRIRTPNNDEFLKKMYRDGVVCGIHYKPAHLNKLYGDIFYPTINYSCDNEPYTQSLPNSEKDGREVVSIPFHEKLTDKEIDKIIKLCIQHTTL